MTTCWTRSTGIPDDAWAPDTIVAQQLKYVREKLDKKTFLNDELATELRRTQAELETRSGLVREKTVLWCAATAELRAAAMASANERQEHDEEMAALRSRLETESKLVREVQERAEKPMQVAARAKEIERCNQQGQVQHQCSVDQLSVEMVRLRSELLAAELKSTEAAKQAENCHQKLAAEFQDVEELWSQRTAEFRSTLSSDSNCEEQWEAALAEVCSLRAALGKAHVEQEGLAIRIRSVEASVAVGSQNSHQVRSMASEVLQAQSTTGEQIMKSGVEQAGDLSGLQSELAERKAEFRTCSNELHSCRLELERTTSEASLAAARTPASHTKRVGELKAEVADLRKAAEEATKREDVLRKSLATEKELHQETFRLLQAQRVAGDDQKSELQQELENLSLSLEQREEDMLSIQFEMASLQNQLSDRWKLVVENADAFQHASEELADKDEKLEDANKAHETLMAEFNNVSSKLQEKVAKLTQELDGSRAAYQALEEQTRSVVKRLEVDRDALSAELERVRLENGKEVADLQDMLKTCEAAGEQQRLKMEAMLEQVEAESASLKTELEVQLGLQQSQGKAAASKIEAVVHETSKQHDRQMRELQDHLAEMTERHEVAEAQRIDLTQALERSRLLERQALEMAEEYKKILETHETSKQMIAKTGFTTAAPLNEVSGDDDAVIEPDFKALKAQQSTENMSPTGGVDLEHVVMPSVLIAVELDLGMGRSATLNIAPWQTRSDFDSAVHEFLDQQRVRPIFAPALVQYLEQVETEAVTFPAKVKAELMDVYSRYG